MPPLQERQFDINEGQVSFVIRPNQVTWNDGQTKILARLVQGPNFVSLVKDATNRLVFSHFSVSNNLHTLAVDASSLSISDEHAFILQWSVAGNRIAIYVDGTLEDSGNFTDATQNSTTTSP